MAQTIAIRFRSRFRQQGCPRAMRAALTWRNRHVLMRGLLVIALVLGVCGMLSVGIAHGVATARSPARTVVSIPKADSEVVLNLSVKARNAAGAHIGGQVRLRRAGSTGGIEIAQFALVAPQSNDADGRSYQFNITDAVRRLNLAGARAEIELALVEGPSGPLPPGAELVLGHAGAVLR